MFTPLTGPERCPPLLRAMVRQTWWTQAVNDFVIRAKLGKVHRDIDQFIQECDDCTLITKDTVPEYFVT